MENVHWKRFMKNHYSPECYDRFLVLKVPFHLILAMAFSIRHVFLVLLAYNPNPKIGESFNTLQPLAQPAFVLTDIPAMLVVAAWIMRTPGAKPFWRWVWKHGRELLTLSFVAHLLVLVYREGGGLLDAFVLMHREKLIIVSFVLDLMMIYYLWRLSIIRDVFDDFPGRGGMDN